MNFINYIDGKEKLWKAWWIFWILPLYILVTLVIYLPKNIVSEMPDFFIGAWFLMGFFMVFGVLSVWRCSFNCKSRGWASIARILIVVSPAFWVGQAVSKTPQTHPPMTFHFVVVCTLLIVILYITTKIIKSTKISDHIFSFLIPSILMAQQFFWFVGLSLKALSNQ